MSSLPHLTTLDVSHNRLTAFPQSCCSLPRLSYLNASHNSLQALPEDGGLEKLNALEINLSGNSLTSLPGALSRCRNLRVLRLEENCLQVAGLPPEMFGESNISLLCLEGNLIQMKELQQVPGYEQVSVWLDLIS